MGATSININQHRSGSTALIETIKKPLQFKCTKAKGDSSPRTICLVHHHILSIINHQSSVFPTPSITSHYHQPISGQSTSRILQLFSKTHCECTEIFSNQAPFVANTARHDVT